MRRAQSSSWNQQHVVALCSALASRQWPQAKLAEANLATPPTSRSCRLCVARGLCDRDTSDRRFAGTLVRRLWTCQVTEPQRQELVPAYSLSIVRNLLRDDGTLPPSHVLLYTRALHRSSNPRLPNLLMRVHPSGILDRLLMTFPLGVCTLTGHVCMLNTSIVTLLLDRVGLLRSLMSMVGLLLLRMGALHGGQVAYMQLSCGPC